MSHDKRLVWPKVRRLTNSISVFLNDYLKRVKQVSKRSASCWPNDQVTCLSEGRSAMDSSKRLFQKPTVSPRAFLYTTIRNVQVLPRNTLITVLQTVTQISTLSFYHESRLQKYSEKISPPRPDFLLAQINHSRSKPSESCNWCCRSPCKEPHLEMLPDWTRLLQCGTGRASCGTPANKYLQKGSASIDMSSHAVCHLSLFKQVIHPIDETTVVARKQ